MIHIAYDFFNTYAHDVAPHAHLWRDVMSGILGISPEDLDLNFQNLRKGVELNFFTDNIPENIDVNAEVIFNFKVNNWFSATLNWNLLYDNDIDILDAHGGYGPRTQFKSVLGIGVSYTMRNFNEE